MPDRNHLPKLSAAIRDARERMNLTQDELAQKLGVSARTVARWEAGDSSPTTLVNKLDLYGIFQQLGMGDAIPELGLTPTDIERAKQLGAGAGAVSGKAVPGLGLGSIATAALFPGFSLVPTLGAIGALAARGFGEKTADAKPKAPANTPKPHVNAPTASSSASPAEELSPFAKQARIFQILSNVSDVLGMDVETFSSVVKALAEELERHDISLEDVRKVLR